MVRLSRMMMEGRVRGACARHVAAPWASAVLMSDG
jgi:hypothetical protein